MTDLPPGRELDALIAEKVMGWRREKVPRDARGESGGSDMLVPPFFYQTAYDLPPLGQIHLTYFVPRYSTEFEVARRALLDKLPDRWLTAFDGRWHIRETLCVTHQGESGEATYETRPLASGETLAHAICLAALKIVEANQTALPVL